MCIISQSEIDNAIQEAFASYEMSQVHSLAEQILDEVKIKIDFNKQFEYFILYGIIPEHSPINKLDMNKEYYLCSKEVVDQFNSIDGVKVKISCQGITGRINYRGLLINIISVHDKLGYIVFETLPSNIGQKLIRFMGLTQATICVDFQRERDGSFYDTKIESLGNNMIFRKEVLKIIKTITKKETILKLSNGH